MKNSQICIKYGKRINITKRNEWFLSHDRSLLAGDAERLLASALALLKQFLQKCKELRKKNFKSKAKILTSED